MAQAIPQFEDDARRRALFIDQATYDWWISQEFPTQPLLAPRKTAANANGQNSDWGTVAVSETDLAETFSPASCGVKLAQPNGRPAKRPGAFSGGIPSQSRWPEPNEARGRLIQSSLA